MSGQITAIPPTLACCEKIIVRARLRDPSGHAPSARHSRTARIDRGYTVSTRHSRPIGACQSRTADVGLDRDFGIGHIGHACDFGIGRGRYFGIGRGRDFGIGHARDFGIGHACDFGIGHARDFGIGQASCGGLCHPARRHSLLHLRAIRRSRFRPPRMEQHPQG
ncbi:hypothetical protein [Actinoplanes subglobosus]|uniref:Uncharacterized protein n=1 Tax=Actinoplanes subglobosus TaxID=1547892 RepID=A0ABV8J797_9ACTN